MYVLLASKQLIPNLTPDSHNAVTPECKPRCTTLVRPLMAFISNFFGVPDSFSCCVVDNELWFWVRFQLKSKSIVIWKLGWCQIVTLLEGKPTTPPSLQGFLKGRLYCFRREIHLQMQNEFGLIMHQLVYMVQSFPNPELQKSATPHTVHLHSHW